MKQVNRQPVKRERRTETHAVTERLNFDRLDLLYNPKQKERTQRKRVMRSERKLQDAWTAGPYWFSLSKAPSKAMLLGEKLIFLTKAQASVAPNSRSMPMSSHSTDNGPL